MEGSAVVPGRKREPKLWKHLLEKKVRVGLRFGARLALPSAADISFGACLHPRLRLLTPKLFVKRYSRARGVACLLNLPSLWPEHLRTEETRTISVGWAEAP